MLCPATGSIQGRRLCLLQGRWEGLLHSFRLAGWRVAVGWGGGDVPTHQMLPPLVSSPMQAQCNYKGAERPQRRAMRRHDLRGLARFRPKVETAA